AAAHRAVRAGDPAHPPGDGPARRRAAGRRAQLLGRARRGDARPRVLRPRRRACNRAGAGSAVRAGRDRSVRKEHMMAGTGFFARLGNLWRGFLSLWISDIEKEHPEIAYENSINSMIDKFAKLKHATAAILRRRDDLDEKTKKATAELAQTEA